MNAYPKIIVEIPHRGPAKVWRADSLIEFLDLVERCNHWEPPVDATDEEIESSAQYHLKSDLQRCYFLTIPEAREYVGGLSPDCLHFDIGNTRAWGTEDVRRLLEGV